MVAGHKKLCEYLRSKGVGESELKFAIMALMDHDEPPADGVLYRTHVPVNVSLPKRAMLSSAELLAKASDFCRDRTEFSKDVRYAIARRAQSMWFRLRDWMGEDDGFLGFREWEWEGRLGWRLDHAAMLYFLPGEEDESARIDVRKKGFYSVTVYGSGLGIVRRRFPRLVSAVRFAEDRVALDAITQKMHRSLL